MTRVLAVVLTTTVLAGCATTPTSENAASEPDDKAYVTGSRLPVRDNSTSASVKGVANKNAIDDMMNRASQTYIPPKGTTN